MRQRVECAAEDGPHVRAGILSEARPQAGCASSRATISYDDRGSQILAATAPRPRSRKPRRACRGREHVSDAGPTGSAAATPDLGDPPT